MCFATGNLNEVNISVEKNSEFFVVHYWIYNTDTYYSSYIDFDKTEWGNYFYVDRTTNVGTFAKYDFDNTLWNRDVRTIETPDKWNSDEAILDYGFTWAAGGNTVDTNVALTDSKTFTQATTVTFDYVDYNFNTVHVYDGIKDRFSVTTTWKTCTYEWTMEELNNLAD